MDMTEPIEGPATIEDLIHLCRDSRVKRLRWGSVEIELLPEPEEYEAAPANDETEADDGTSHYWDHTGVIPPRLPRRGDDAAD